MTIQTEHNGRRIVYAENEDVWRCWDADGCEGKTLSAVRAKLDKLDADARRIDAVRAHKVDTHGAKLTEVAIVLIAKPGRPGSYGADRVEVFVSSVNGDGKAREKVGLDRLIPATPEARAAVEVWRARQAETRAAQAIEKAALEAIPRFTLADLTTKEVPTDAPA